MSLTSGRGPLGTDPSGRFTPPITLPVVLVEPHPRRVQAYVGDRAVIDTEEALLVHRAGAPLSFAFPAALVDLPAAPVAEAPGFVSVAWDAVDHWVEEGRRLVHYPPNPYHRVDCRPTDRRLRVSLDGTVLVDTSRTVILFETALAPVLYVARDQVVPLVRSTSGRESYCNYKGVATYWSASVGDELHEDVAWSYEEPLPESTPIRGLLAFDPSRVTVDADLPQSHQG